MTARRYWRVLVLATRTADTYAAQIAEIQLRATVGGADQTTSGGGSPTASSTNTGSSAANCFDNSASTNWVSLLDAVLPQWVRYDFGSDVDIAEVAIQAGDTSARAARAPRTFFLQSSPDDTNWSSVAYVPDEAAWSTGETRSFAVASYPTDSQARRYWRLYVTATETVDAYAVGIGELYLNGTIGGADLTSSDASAPSASSAFVTGQATAAFDDSYSTRWLSASGQALPQWIAYDFGDALGYEVRIAEVGIRAPETGPERAPTDFALQSSADGATWATTISVTGETGWTTSEVRYFSATDVEAIAAAESPLGASLVQAWTGDDRFGLSSCASPLGAVSALAFNDFTGRIDPGAPEFWFCDLIDGASTWRVGISSWQGTLQLTSSSYLQAVIPAAEDIADTVLALSVDAEFAISRRSTLRSGAVVEVEMARSVVEQVQLDRGPRRYTCTISGYSSAFTAPAVAYSETDRTLTGIRSISSGSSGTRVRCAIDWLLQPGQMAIADGTTFEASYINYYVQARESYMDVGERVP